MIDPLARDASLRHFNCSTKTLCTKSCVKLQLMVARKGLMTVTQTFLEAVADAAKFKLGPNPKRTQRSQWMVSNKSNGMSSQDFERSIFDRESIIDFYRDQLLMSKGLVEQQRLIEALSEAGIVVNEQPYGFMLPLVRNWLLLEDPFEFNESITQRLLDEFADAVLNGMVVTRLRTAISDFNIGSMPILFEKGITIRQITIDELWEYGDIDKLRFHLHPLPGFPPNEAWKILDIELRQNKEMALSPARLWSTRESVLILLRLESTGPLKFLDLGSEANYGLGSNGAIIERKDVETLLMPKGRYWGSYILNPLQVQHLQNSWSRMREIMDSDSHYLRLPAQRLFDAGEREMNQLTDAILDYAIGLECLLTPGIRDELSYRFALRGATILGWENGNKQSYFEKLKGFYRIRSSIVHGNQVDKNKLDDTCSIGEDYLRKIWWWYFTNKFPKPIDGAKMIDQRILE